MEAMQFAVLRAIKSLVYGVTAGPEWEDMHPYPNVLERVIQEVGTTAIGSKTEVGMFLS